MGELFRRLRYFLNRRRFDRELESDMEFHREMAARAGRTNFGNVLRLREDARQAWGWTWIDGLMQDLRYAVRVLRRSPGFTITAVLVLGIGIGVNIAAFTLFNLMALKPLPIRDPDSIVRLQRRSPEINTPGMPYLMVEFYRRHAKTLRAVMATMGAPPIEFENDTQPAKVNFVTANYFSELGTVAGAGRLLQTGRDDAPDSAPVVVLSYGFWQRQFGGDPSIVGKVIHLNRKPATVIGVTPYAFASLDGQYSDVWLPLMEQPYFIEGSNTLTDPMSGSVRMWGRLAPGVTAQAAAQELSSLTNELRKIYPKAIWDKEYIRVDPGGHLKVMQPEMYQVAAMVGALALLILAVACANLGGLMIARGITREREIGIRLAVGASRKRIFRQLFTESLLLALLGCLAGACLSWIALECTFAALDVPGWISASPDWRVLLFGLGMVITAAVFFGLAPAWQVARQLYRKTIARQVLVAAQLAASCILLIVAGLLVRAVHHVLYTNPGFGYQQVIGINPGLESHGYTPAAAREYINALTNRLRAIPGVQSVGLSKIPLLGHGLTSYMTTVIGGHPVNIYPNWVDPEFFRAMEIRILRGRTFFPADKNAAIVSESLARKQWPGQDPLGKPLWRDGTSKDRIIGVASNARVKALNDGDAVEVYWAARGEDMPAMTVLVKTSGAPDGMTSKVKSISESLDPKVFPSIWLLKSGFHETARDLEKLALAVTLLGMVAITIAGVGLVGLVAYTVSQQKKEIAIRIALGAQHARVLTAIVRQFLWPIVLGILVGSGITAGISKILRKTLYGVSNLDPATYGAAVMILVFISGMAALLPARRVLRLNISKTLRYQ
jgi:predicted permease